MRLVIESITEEYSFNSSDYVNQNVSSLSRLLVNSLGCD